jgi:hypothetical protein
LGVQLLAAIPSQRFVELHSCVKLLSLRIL